MPDCWDHAADQPREGKPLLIRALAALVDSDGRVLITRLAAPHTGAWDFPGGMAQAEETPERALMRHLADALGVETRLGCLAPLTFTHDACAGLALLYVCRIWRGAFEARSGCAWVAPRRLGDWPMPPAARAMAALLRDCL